MKQLLKELQFQIDMLDENTIDNDDFVNAITEIKNHYLQDGTTIVNGRKRYYKFK